MPDGFEIKQFSDFNYKLPNGESLNEVKERLYKKLMSIIKENEGKRILIVFHSTAMMTLLSTWCKVSYDAEYTFNNEVFFVGNFSYCETFKLEFDNSDLIDIKNIKFD